MSTLTGPDLPKCLADILADAGADLNNEAICTFLLARTPDFLLSEIAEHVCEAMDIATEAMAEGCARSLADLRRDIDAEMAR
jgi:hypothetical protein